MESTIAAYRRAFRRYGLDVETLSGRQGCGTGTYQLDPRGAGRGAGSLVPPYTGDAKQTAKLRALCRAADPDPRGRTQACATPLRGKIETHFAA